MRGDWETEYVIDKFLWYDNKHTDWLKVLIHKKNENGNEFPIKSTVGIQFKKSVNCEARERYHINGNIWRAAWISFGMLYWVRVRVRRSEGGELGWGWVRVLSDTVDRPNNWHPLFSTKGWMNQFKSLFWVLWLQYRSQWLKIVTRVNSK